jgi:autotransporter-associated beta strand protein
MPSTLHKFRFLLWASVVVGLPCSLFAADESPLASSQSDVPAGHIYSGPYVGGAFQSLTFVNDLVGWRDYFSAGYQGASTVIANVEAGLIWYGHEAFRRPSDATTGLATFTNTNSLNQLDFHATMVGHVLAGSGYVTGTSPPQYAFVGLGMASQAALISAGVATNFSASSVGSFGTSYDSVITPYKALFTGVGATRADVINSSWGGSDPAAGSYEAFALDGLSALNPEVAFVCSAGNSDAAPVGWPASGFNNIAVGSLGGNNFLVSSDFSSRGLVDFYNPVTQTVVTNARVALDISAPGEYMVLAAYLGDSGGIGASTNPAIRALIQQPSPTGQYFLNMDGTSFASPIVAGGIALLKDVAKTHPFLNLTADTNALDTRVVKSVIMAGARETFAWNNGQSVASNGVVRTTQALDAAAGAGAFHLGPSTTTYFFGTTDVEGGVGGAIGASGWDFGTIALGGTNSYIFDGSFATDAELTVSLNWFAGRTFDSSTDLGADLSFADLNLEVWETESGIFTSKVGESLTLYNNAEFLRLDLSGGKTYGLRVLMPSFVFNSNGATNSSYGLAWIAQGYRTLYWDPDGTNGSVPVVPSGLWDGLAANFNTSSDGTGGAPEAITTGLDVLVFSAGTNATGSGTITVSGPQMSRGLVLEDGALTFAGTNNAFIQIQTEGITVKPTVGSAPLFASSLSLYLDGNQSWSNGSTSELIISSSVVGVGDLALRAGSSGAIRMAGSIDHSGSIANRGIGTATSVIGGLIGTNVTAVYQQSDTSRLVLSRSNSFAGSAYVEAGTLELSGPGGALGRAASIGVSVGATLLLSTGGQINDSAVITLSGGTILRGVGVSEVFGNLNVTHSSFLDFGTGTPGTLAFGAYAPSALLTVNNFLPGNSLVFASDLGSVINDGSLFSFSHGFNTIWSGGNFTITAIPEPSAFVAAFALLGVLVASQMRRLRLRR